MSSSDSLFPFKPPVEVAEQETKIVELFSEEAVEIFDVLGSETARHILRKLNEEPATKSEIAEYTDTTVQNVKYHVDRMQAAGLITVVGTHYSTRGVQMDVYSLDGDPLVIIGGDDAGSIPTEAAVAEPAIQSSD